MFIFEAIETQVYFAMILFPPDTFECDAGIRAFSYIWRFSLVSSRVVVC